MNVQRGKRNTNAAAVQGRVIRRRFRFLIKLINYSAVLVRDPGTIMSICLSSISRLSDNSSESLVCFLVAPVYTIFVSKPNSESDLNCKLCLGVKLL